MLYTDIKESGGDPKKGTVKHGTYAHFSSKYRSRVSVTFGRDMWIRL